MPLLAGGLISGNAVVTIENVTIVKDATGKTVESHTTLAAGVSVLLSQDSANRPDDADNLRNVQSGTMTGASASLARSDVRYLVTGGPYGLTGIYLYPENASVHGAAGEGIMAAAPWYVVKWSTVRST